MSRICPRCWKVQPVSAFPRPGWQSIPTMPCLKCVATIGKGGTDAA